MVERAGEGRPGWGGVSVGIRERGGADSGSDWELRQIELARRDPAAFAPLYEAHVDLVWRYAMSRLGDQERAADVTSQTFIKAIVALPGFRGEPGKSTFRSWLMAIAHNAVIDDCRKTKPALPLDDPVAGRLADRGASPEDAAIAWAERQRIQGALAQLTERQRSIVELRAAGMRGAEIAALLGMTVPAVKTANHRAYQRLRDLLTEEQVEGISTP